MADALPVTVQAELKAAPVAAATEEIGQGAAKENWLINKLKKRIMNG